MAGFPQGPRGHGPSAARNERGHAGSSALAFFLLLAAGTPAEAQWGPTSHVPGADAAAALSATAAYMLIGTEAPSYVGQPTPRALRESADGTVLVTVQVRDVNLGVTRGDEVALAGAVAETLGRGGIDAEAAERGIINDRCPLAQGGRQACAFDPGVGLVVALSYPVTLPDGRLRVPMSTFTEARDASGAPIRSNFDVILGQREGQWEVVDVQPLRLW
jgi:hypothetical protein